MRRVFYTAAGYTLGVGTGWYVQRRLKRTVERVAPEQVRAEVADRSRQVADVGVQAATRARDLASSLREAAQEGVATMRQEQTDLLGEFAADEAMHTGPARRLPGRGETASGGGYRPRR
ncbi:MAG: hypothetical protein P8I99_15055 [Acidimicrobiales bacterium]|nr:hypothetical protein [Acidimicrobiales bacterium]MDG1878725.1 hypothetical protein [Acidimicrobiales bacterium]